MKVWVVLAGDYDDHSPHEVAATEALAWECAARIANDQGYRSEQYAREHRGAVYLKGYPWPPSTPEEIGRRARENLLASVEVVAFEVVG